MKIFIISETLTTGGAEWFSLRLANALIQQGQQVFFFVLRPDMINEKIRNKFGHISIITLNKNLVKLIANADRVVKKITGRYILVEKANIGLVKKYLLKYKPQAIHGHLIEPDLVAVKVNTGGNNVATIHGDYIGAIKENKRGKEIRQLLTSLTHIAVISDEQKHILTAHFPECANKITKIYNGYPLPKKEYLRSEDSCFYFGMIARAIPEKGWRQLIDAFARIDDKNARLVLYGEGNYLNELRVKNTDTRINFAGFTEDPLEAINKMHVGMLPSYFSAESLPTTVIEYLAMQKPVIATNVGEVKNMIQDNEGNSAGIIINETDKDTMVEPLYKAMKKMLEDKNFYKEKKAVCASAFEKFSMDKCIDAYMQLYANKQPVSCAV